MLTINKKYSSYNKEIILKTINKTFEVSYPENYLKNKIIKNKNKIVINKTKIDINKKTYLIGFGKVAPFISKALLKILGSKKVAGGIIISSNIKKTYFNKNIQYLPATHPHPSNISMKSTSKLIKFLEKLEKNSNIISIVSGGGSSCLISPVKGVMLKDDIKLNDLLILKDIPIDQINIVRGFFSNVKYGKLAKKIYPNKIINLIVSDDPKNIIKSVGSGATVFNNSTKHNVIKILKKNKILNKIPKRMSTYLKDLNSQNAIMKKNSTENIIFDNKSFLNNFAYIAKKNKIKKVAIYPKILCDNLNKSKKKFINFCKKFRNQKNVLLIFGSEMLINVTCKNSKGGRVQHFAAECVKELNQNFNDFIFASFSTDGHDYIKNISGVMYNKSDTKKILQKPKKFNNYLKKFNSYKIFQETNLLLKLKSPTKNNVFDVLLLYIN
jgi:glycerate 2-kinase